MGDNITIVPGNCVRMVPLRSPEELDAMKAGELIDCGMEDFLNYVARLNLGECLSLRNFLALTYNKLSDAREEILAKVKKGELEKDDAKVIETLSGLYNVMARIESKYPYVGQRIKSIVEKDPYHNGLLEK